VPSAENLIKRFSGMKTLPHVAIRLSKLISNESTTAQQFEDVIKLDPTLVLRLLRVANSSYYGLQKKVESISRAIVFIGMKNLRNMVVTTSLKDIFKKGQNEDLFSREKLWLHCAAVGICAKMIAERIFGKTGEDFYLCGILHDIGLIVEDHTVNDLLIEMCKAYMPGGGPITEYEQEVIGTNHSEIGYLLTKEWGLPVEVQEGIRFHHDIGKEYDPSGLIGIIQMSEYIVSQMNYVAIPNLKALLAQNLKNYMRENIAEFKALMNDFPDEMEKAKELYESDKKGKG